jgi:hypothetical protein
MNEPIKAANTEERTLLEYKNAKAIKQLEKININTCCRANRI